MTKLRPEREKEIAARKAAIAAARLMLSGNKSQEQAAEATGSKRASVSNGMLILNHGTAEEIEGVESGTLSLDRTADKIRERTTPQERAAKRRAPTQTEALVKSREFDAEIWGGLRNALDAIAGLPSPKDTAVIVRKNAMRIEHVNRKLLVALEWITEFSNEITL